MAGEQGGKGRGARIIGVNHDQLRSDLSFPQDVLPGAASIRVPLRLVHLDELHKVTVLPQVPWQLHVEPILLYLPLRTLLTEHVPAPRVLASRPGAPGLPIRYDRMAP